MSGASLFIHVWRCAAIFRALLGFWLAKRCIRLDLPVPFAPKTKINSPGWSSMFETAEFCEGKASLKGIAYPTGDRCYIRYAFL